MATAQKSSQDPRAVIVTLDQGSDETFYLLYDVPIGTLTGYTAELILTRQGSTTPELTLTTGAGLTIDAAVSPNKVTCTFTNAQTSALSGVYAFLCRVIAPGGAKTRIAQGLITIDNGGLAND